MKVLVLAAGRGTRMKHLTNEKPKHMIDVGGKPFLHYLLSNLKLAGFDDIAVVVCYKKDVIGDWVENNNIGVTLIEQGEPQGTGDAVRHAEQWAGNDDFVVIMGDNLYSAGDMKRMMKKDSYSYIAAATGLDQTKLGAIVAEGDLLKGIVEKPPKQISDISNVGMYKFTHEIFDVLKKIGKSPRGEYELTDAIEMLAKKRKMKIVILKDYWIDFTSPDDVPKVMKFLKDNGHN